MKIANDGRLMKLKYSLYLATHPMDGFWDLKYAGKGSMGMAAVLFLLYYFSVLVRRQLTAWQFNPYQPEYLNIVSEFFTSLGPYVIWCVAAWCVTSLLEGQGTMKDITKACAYSLAPLILSNLFGTLVSNLIVSREYMFYTILTTIGTYWTLGLIFLSVISIHQYTVTKAIFVTILSLIGMVIIVCLGILLFYLVQQLAGFATDVLKEYSIRIAE